MTGSPDIIDPDAPVTVQDAANKGNEVIGGDGNAPAVHLGQEISDMTPGFVKRAGDAIGHAAQKVAEGLASLDHSPPVESSTGGDEPATTEDGDKGEA